MRIFKMLAGAWHFFEIGVGTAENGTFEVSERGFTSGHIYTTLSPSLLECFNVSGEILSNVKQPTLRYEILYDVVVLESFWLH